MSYPGSANEYYLTHHRSTINLFFHGKNESSYTVLALEDAEKLTVGGLFLRSKSLGYVTEGAKATEKCVQIRFVFDELTVVSRVLSMIVWVLPDVLAVPSSCEWLR
jgi:hypothetical protein